MSNNNLVEMGYIPREIEAKIDQLLKLPQIIALVGPRRSGKTTLLLRLKEKLTQEGKKVVYLSFEDQEVLSLFVNDIKNFARLYLAGNQFLLLDEFHYAKNGGRQLKFLFDFYPKKKIIVSSSSSTELAIRALQYLVGRALTVTLYPFSFAEFLRAKDKQLFTIWQREKGKKLVNSPLFSRLNALLEEYLLFGGYPEIVLTPQKEIKQELLTNIVNLLFLREVKDFLSFANTLKLQKLIKALSLQIGNLVNLNELSQVTQLDFKTLKRYLAFLEKTFIIRRVGPFFSNKRKELVKASKIYFLDPGLRNAVIGQFSYLNNRTDVGPLLENGVFVFLRQQQVKFWRTKNKTEVDFVLEKNGQIIPLEIKAGGAGQKIPRPLRSFLETYQPKMGFVVSLTPQWQEKMVAKSRVSFVPLALLPKSLA